MYLQGWHTEAKSHNAFSRIKRRNAVWPPEPRASECETLTLSGSVWFTFHVLMACPLRHSTYLFAAYISMPSLAEATGSGEGEEGKVERTSNLNSSFCTPFTFTDRHRTHTHTLASVPDLTKPSLLRAKVKQMQLSHCYSLNKRVRMNKQRPSGGRNIAEWMRCLGRGQGEVTVTVSEPQARPLVVSSRQQVDRWCNWPETPTRETFWCYLYLQQLLHLLTFSTCVLKGLPSLSLVLSLTVFHSVCSISYINTHLCTSSISALSNPVSLWQEQRKCSAWDSRWLLTSLDSGTCLIK